MAALASESPLALPPLSPGAEVAFVGGKYKGNIGTVEQLTPKKVHVSSPRLGKVCVEQRSVSTDASEIARLMDGLDVSTPTGTPSSLAPRSSPRTACTPPMWALPSGSPRAGDFAFTGPGTKTVIGEEKETCLLRELLGPRAHTIEKPLPRSFKDFQPIPMVLVDNGRRYEFVACKVFADGNTAWGGKKKSIRSVYTAVSGPDFDDHTNDLEPISLESELDRIGDFSSLEPRKCASRLELLQSPAPKEQAFEMDAAQFERIAEPQPSKESGGCGFIPTHLLAALLGGGKVACRVTSVQVRMFAPKLGVFKGMLAAKSGIERVQLPPSMLKVGPSRTNGDATWAWLLIKRTQPSKTNLQIQKWLEGKKVADSFRQRRFSPMIGRLLGALGVPPELIDAYAKPPPPAGGGEGDSSRRLRKEAWLAGIADPTDAIPPGHVVVPGLPEESVPVAGGGERRLFVTRSPCTKPSDGQMVPVLTRRPPAMLEADWAALQSRHFGEIIFPNAGCPLPESISEGDIDGDLYCVLWDAQICGHVRPQPEGPEALDGSSRSAKEEEGQQAAPRPMQRPHNDASLWLARAQAHMVDPEVLREQLDIGKLYCAAERKADQSEMGLHDPDARAYFSAYRQAIDRGKHGDEIVLPDHLREEIKWGKK